MTIVEGNVGFTSTLPTRRGWKSFDMVTSSGIDRCRGRSIE
jgi:hypothetical protein